MHSISDLTTFCRKTSGDVPAKLVVSSSFSSSPFPPRRAFAGCIHHRRRIQSVFVCEPTPHLALYPSDIFPGWSSGYRTTHGFRPLCLRSRHIYLGKDTPISGGRCPRTPLFSQRGNMQVTCFSPFRLFITRSQGTINSLFLVEWQVLPIHPVQRIFAS